MIKTKQQLFDAVPVQTMECGTRYVRVNDIPEPWRMQAQNDIRGCACPVVEGQGPLYYARDFQDWVQGRWWGTPGPKGLA